MPISDRAFRALAQAEPDVIVALLAALAPRVVRRGARVRPEAVDDPTLVAPPSVDADFVARVGSHDVLHVECQGYRDDGFPDRVVYYHLGFMVRYRPRRVRTVALWMTAPPERQRRTLLRLGDVTVRITSLVLPELPAAVLLRDPRTACFAPGADAGEWTAEELCRRTVHVMKEAGASYNQRHVAVVAAMMRGRYKEMVKAMDEASMEPVIIEDLVKFGIDQGIEKGIKKGRLEETREALLEILEVRGLKLRPAQRRLVLAETSIARLRALRLRALTARTVAELLAD